MARINVQAMKGAHLLDVLCSRLAIALDGMTVDNQLVTAMMGERA